MVDGYKEFMELRRKVMKALSNMDTSYGKSYEGTF